MKTLNLFRKTTEKNVSSFNMFAISNIQMNYVRGGGEPIEGREPGAGWMPDPE